MSKAPRNRTNYNLHHSDFRFSQISGKGPASRLVERDQEPGLGSREAGMMLER